MTMIERPDQRILGILFMALGLCLGLFPVHAQEAQPGGEQDLAKKTQNPVSDLISLPFQFNFTSDVGPDEGTLTVLNIQPVIPVGVGNWNLINRPIIPLIDQPSLVPGGGGETGVGDVLYQLFFSPKDSGKWIWGVGPALGFPTASEDALGSEKWTAGPAFVALTMPGRWVIGALAFNIWDYAGDDDRADVNLFTLQYFVNYNFDKGWYFSSAPVNTANWEASSGQKWTVPIGGGFGKITRIGKRPVNIQAQVFYNVEKPDSVGDWAARLQFQLLFPK